MRISFSFLLGCMLTLPAWAQLSYLPPSSISDGIYLRPFSTQVQETGWNSSELSSYRLSAGNAASAPSDGSVDAFGRKWTSAAPNRAQILAGGGTLRGILLGSSGPAFQSVGYSYSGAPDAADSFTLAYPTTGNTPGFGDCVDVRLLAQDAVSFDFWVCTPSGAYTVFTPSNGNNVPTVQGQVLWTEAPLLIPTFIPALNSTAMVETWIGSVVEQGGSGGGQTEFRFALQQFPISGSSNQPLPGAPVPEPSSYVLLGAACCAIAVLRRTLRRA